MGKTPKSAPVKTSGKASSGHRKTKAALAAGAVASTVAATAAYRRHHARRHLSNASPTPNRSDTAPSPATPPPM